MMKAFETSPRSSLLTLSFNRKLALVGIIPIKFSSLSAPTKIEELTAGSDEKNTAQPRRESNPIRKTLGSIPGGAALCFFV